MRVSGSDAVSAALIGRRRELDELEAGFRAAYDGSPRIVFVGGETGIGKSRLLAEFVAVARQRGPTLALFGAAPALVGQDLPFAPLVGLLRDLGRQLEPAELRRLVPVDSELARLTPDLAAQAGPPAADAGAQLRLFEQVIALFAELGAIRPDWPLLVVLEDLHWADSSTRDLLAYVLRNLTRGRVLIVASYRSTDLGPAHPLRRLLVEAVRQPHVRQLELEPLDPAETEALIAALAGATGSKQPAAAVAQRSAGNPLFVEQLLQAPARDVLPASLVNLLREQVASLSRESRQLTNLAATAGTAVPAPVLEAACKAVSLDLVAAVGPLREAGVLVVERNAGGEWYSFRHPLLQEVIYSELVPGERAQLHHILAFVLSRGTPAGSARADLAIDVARHWWSAGQPGEAYPWLVRAAEAAESVFAFAEANSLFERAIEAARHTTSADAPTRRPIGFQASAEPAGEQPGTARLFERAAQAASLCGRPQRALELLGALVDGQDGALDAHLLARRGQYEWESGARREALDTYRQAVARLSTADPAQRAQVLRSAARTFLLASDFATAREMATRAVAEAREAGAGSDERQALYTLGAALAHLGEVGAAVEAIEHAREAEQREQRLSRISPRPSRIVDLLAGYWSQAAVLSRAGQAEASAAAALEGVRRARELGAEKGWGGLVGAAALDELVDLGRWGEAQVLMADLLDGEVPGPPEVYAASAHLLALTGRLAEGLEQLARARTGAMEIDDPRVTASLARATAELGLGTGQLSETSRALDEALTELGPNADLKARAELLALALRTLADRAQLARSRRSTAEAAEIELLAAVLHGRVVALLGGNGAGAGRSRTLHALLRLAVAEHSRAIGAADARPWQELAEQWHALREPYRAAYARWRAAEVLLAAPEGRATGRELLIAGHRACLELGAEPLRREIEGLARRARVALDAAPDDAGDAASDSPAEPDGAMALGLSTRELEVLGLLAEGRTNRQIADTLFISPKTAGHHVSSILGKLGVSSRVEAAAIAVRAGVAGAASAVAQAAVARDVDARSGLASASTSVSASGLASPDQLPLTLMFTDIVKSTPLLEAIGDEAWSALIDWHDATLRSMFRSYSGREIDHAGDGFFVVFPDIVAGLDCSIAVQRTLAEHRRRHGFAPRLRIALHTAPVTRQGNAVQGRGVHEAARIAAAAGTDEILVSFHSLAAFNGRYVRLEPRQIDAAGFAEPISVVPIRWQMGGAPADEQQVPGP